MARKQRPAHLLGRRILSPILEFIKDSRAVGVTLICCTMLSLFLSNSAWGEGYMQFWLTEIHLPTNALTIPHTFLHMINDGLMALFFLLVGMEIKRELVNGELSSVKKSLMPILGAVGGMVVPALIYIMWCGGTPYASGWGVPMATDIAFSLGVLSLLGKRAPMPVKIFLTALAIIDDLGAIVAIALFYTNTINLTNLAIGGGIFGILLVMNRMKVSSLWLYFVLGAGLWYFIFNSGVHATIAGVLLAFTIPVRKIDNLEHALHDPVSFIILPLFALANTAIALPDDFSVVYSSNVHHGIFMGLVLGKPLGIFLVCFLAVKLRVASLPKLMTWNHVIGMGLLAGIGFTMSIFIATLAFDSEQQQVVSKVAIIGASAVSAVLGFLYLYLQKIKPVVQPEGQ